MAAAPRKIPPIPPAQYRVIFTTDWGTPGNPAKAPPGSHTGNMFLVVHTDKYHLFSLGEKPSAGIQETSMWGTLENLAKEARNAKDKVYSAYQHEVINTPGQAIFDINVDSDHPYASFVTMIAPSPDYFTGVSQVPLMTGDSQTWVEFTRVPLYPYKAGSDKGYDFTLKPKHPQVPPNPISYLTGEPLYSPEVLYPVPLAMLDFQRTG